MFVLSLYIQKELDSLAHTWNYHRLQRHHNMVEPCGKPIILYTSPELYNTEDKLVDIDVFDVEACIDECVFKDGNPCSDSTVLELSCDYMVENNLDYPHDTQEATQLYLRLREKIYRDLWTCGLSQIKLVSFTLKEAGYA